VAIQMQWPFHGSGSGGDFYLLHGTMTLQDGSGLHADVAVQLSQTFKSSCLRSSGRILRLRW